MYTVHQNGRSRLEADACGIGFVASRKGVADRQLVDAALAMCQCFDHRGAPGHGAGIMIEIPWPLLVDKFPDHVKLIAQRDVALGSFFLPFDSPSRRRCVAAVEDLAHSAGAEVLQWVDVPINVDALPEGSAARRTLPVVRHALIKRPDGMGEDAWFACRYLLRLALDNVVGREEEEFYVVSLSNRTLVYKGLAELSRIADLYPDLRDPHLASRFVLFHSRYCTNTTTAWRRAQPFWSIAHNGEIATIQGNVAWMNAIGQDLLDRLSERHPALKTIAQLAGRIVAEGGSDTANLDDMVIALIAGGMTIPQSLLALMPEAQVAFGADGKLTSFFEAMSVYLGACDGPAALVACDGDHAVAHLDRNGLRPLWITTTADYAVAASELTGLFPTGAIEQQRLLGPGETVVVDLRTGQISLNDQVHEQLARQPFPTPNGRLVRGKSASLPDEAVDLPRLQRAFGMTKEDLDVVIRPLVETGKPALGSMGDDATISALLDEFPRRLEDYFALRFAQETSPPIDPIRDAWVFDPTVSLGDRGGLWGDAHGPVIRFGHRVLSLGETAWLLGQGQVRSVNAVFEAREGSDGLERALNAFIDDAVTAASETSVLVLSDRNVTPGQAPLPMLRLISRLHERLVREGVRHRVGLVADTGAWDIHHCAYLVANGADAVCPWLGCRTAADREDTYLHGLRDGFIEAMSMMGVTPSSAYCGARLVEAVGLDASFLKSEFPGVPGHLGGIGRETLNAEWLGFHRAAFHTDSGDTLRDVGEFRHAKSGRPHFNNADVVRKIHSASGFSKKAGQFPPGSYEAYRAYADVVEDRLPVTALDCLRLKAGRAIPLDEVESEDQIAWRFMAPGMSEGALSEPAHRAIAGGMNLLYRYCRMRAAWSGRATPPGIGPIANSGEGGFDKDRMRRRDGNRSVQYSGGRFTITPMTAARADEAEVKFAQGAKPGKGGQLPGRKVSPLVALRRGCEPGYELISPPINHNLYSIEDVKLMIESWRHLNPSVNCALKYVATYGVEMVALGGVNAGANRLHLSDGCGGTGAAKRVDQKHAGVPVLAVLPTVQDMLVEEGVRHLVELSVDGGVQSGQQVLKLVLLGADRVGFGTSLLMAIGCSMLRKCHLAGPDPTDPTGKRRLGCAPGVATQDPFQIEKFTGQSRQVARFLLHVARDIREQMAARGIRRLSDVVGRRDLLEKRPDLTGKASLLQLSSILSAPHGASRHRDYHLQTDLHMPHRRLEEIEAAAGALRGAEVRLESRLSNEDRCVGLAAAGTLARARGDLGLSQGRVRFEHHGAAGHFYGAYSVNGLEFRLVGLMADSAWTASYGGKLAVIPPDGNGDLTLVGNTFAYGARGGQVYIAGRAGNRFGICLRKDHEGTGPRIVVEGVEANAFQYMTGGTALVLGSTGHNLGSGMTGGKVFLLDPNPACLNASYVHALELSAEEGKEVLAMLIEHYAETGSRRAKALLMDFEPLRFRKVVTRVVPEPIELLVPRPPVEAETAASN